MRAVVIREPGDVDRLLLEELPRPTPAEGQVLVRVRAAGVCHRDLLDRRGAYPFMKRPVVTGHELAGEVVARGPGATRFAVGARVVNLHRPPCGSCPACRAGETPRCIGSVWSFGLTMDGAYAEYAVAHEAALVPIPDGVDDAGACFLFCTAAVALRALRHQGRLVAGERVLVTGASGGVGVHAIQVAKILGAHVVAVTGRADKAEALRAVGADEVIVEPGDFRREALRLTDGGAHLALELVGAPTFNASLRSLRAGGRLVLVGNVTTARVEVNPGWVILREATVSGSQSASAQDLAEVLAWAAAGTLRPIVAATLPLDEARAAQERIARRDVVGRIVLVP